MPLVRDRGGGVAPGPVIGGKCVMLATVEGGVKFVTGILGMVKMVDTVADVVPKMDVGWVKDVDGRVEDGIFHRDRRDFYSVETDRHLNWLIDGNITAMGV